MAVTCFWRRVVPRCPCLPACQGGAHGRPGWPWQFLQTRMKLAASMDSPPFTNDFSAAGGAVCWPLTHRRSFFPNACSPTCHEVSDILSLSRPQSSQHPHQEETPQGTGLFAPPQEAPPRPFPFGPGTAAIQSYLHAPLLTLVLLFPPHLWGRPPPVSTPHSHPSGLESTPSNSC